MAQLPMLRDMKPILDEMQRYLAESLGTCDNLQQNLNLSPGMELLLAKQRITELENENESLRRFISQSPSAAMTESLQMDVDRHLMKAKLENEELQDRIRQLKEENEHLKQQISAYKEDFEIERKDRENAHSVIADLKNQIKILHERNPASEGCTRTPHQFSQANRIRGFDVCDSGRDVTDSRSRSRTVISNETDGLRSISPAGSTAESVLFNNHEVFDLRDDHLRDDDHLREFVLTGRGVVDFRPIQQQHGTDGRIHNPGVWGSNRTYSTTDYSRGHTSSHRQYIGSSFCRQDSDEEVLTLSCPNCRKRFSTEDHLLLIDHLEICN